MFPHSESAHVHNSSSLKFKPPYKGRKREVVDMWITCYTKEIGTRFA